MDTPILVLRKYWKHQHFRPLQEEIITSILEGYDALVLMPTGGGKSVCFQVPAMIRKGICIVVTPLISLMRDQVDQLKKRTISAIAVHSGMRRDEIDILLDNCIYGHIKFLYVSPERLQTELFRERFKQMNVGMVVVDEAHCISQWGYDFRPAYLKISGLRELNAEVPIIALTATADKRVQDDVMEKLEFRKGARVFRKSFYRENLSFVVRKAADKTKKLVEILSKVPGSAIVYVRHRKATEELAGLLNRSGISASYYHAGLTATQRTAHQDGWMHENSRIMVATNAFGMGIDKANVRTVVHMDIPENMESYYQEAGRAGRDGNRAYAVIVYVDADVEQAETRVLQAYPTLKYMARVYQCLANYYQLPLGSGEGESFDMDLHNFSERFKLNAIEAYNAIRKLEEEGLLVMAESFYTPSRIHFGARSEALYEFQVAHARFDPLIKMLLRLYGGEMFSGYVRISESQLAQGLENTVEEVTAMLKHLDTIGMARYISLKDKPQVTFTTPRVDADHLPIDRQWFEARRELMTGKVKKMASFVDSRHRCRMQVIQEYFDEITEQECGICDVCIAKRKKDNEAELVRLKSRVLEELTSQKMPLENLESRIAPAHSDLFVEAVRDLLDEDQIAYDQAWNLKRAS